MCDGVRCLTPPEVCDGVVLCADGSDEDEAMCGKGRGSGRGSAPHWPRCSPIMGSCTSDWVHSLALSCNLEHSRRRGWNIRDPTLTEMRNKGMF